MKCKNCINYNDQDRCPADCDPDSIKQSEPQDLFKDRKQYLSWRSNNCAICAIGTNSIEDYPIPGCAIDAALAVNQLDGTPVPENLLRKANLPFCESVNCGEFVAQ